MEAQLLDCSLRAALMAVGTAVALGALRVRSAAARHIAWTGVMAAMLLLPALSAWGPMVAVLMLPVVPEQPAPEPLAPKATSMRPAPQSVEDKRTPDASAPRAIREVAPPGQVWDWSLMTLACYFIGFGVMIIRLAAGTIQARKMARQATFVEGALVSAQCAAPVTVGWLRPVVILPEGGPEGGPEDSRSWPEAKLDAVLTHEREHARRRDPLVQWLALLNRCVFWFHPLAWWLERKLSDLAEEACDAAVLRRGHNPADYSQYLIELARSVEIAGARVNVRSAAINGGALSRRIRRILDSKPLPPLSRTRSTVAATLCLSVLAIFLACKPERASKLAPGQPSMNELMHRKIDVEIAKGQAGEKQRQALMDEIKKLTADQAKALEAELKMNPRDNEKLNKLVLYYQHRLGGQGFSAIALWYIEHEPAMAWAWNIDPAWDRAGYEQGKKLWLEHINKPRAEAANYRNAARFLEVGDKPLAEQALLAGQKAHLNENWAVELSEHYTRALLGSTGPMAEFYVSRSVRMEEARGAYAQSVRKKLATSNDPQILTQTASSLFLRSLQTDCNNQSLFDFDVRALARWYNDRALSLQPDYPAAVSLKQGFEAIATGERIHKTPPDKLSQSDQLLLLRRQMETAFWDRKMDEAESKARELLALAEQSTNAPDYGNEIFFANLSFGYLALQRGEKSQAARYLLSASGAPPTDRLRNESIDMTLARQLVDWGEREAVAQFLDRCARFNHRGKELAEWAAQIRKGINPDITPYHRSGHYALP